jgi:Mg-chelatase subunit ChlD
VTDGTWFLHVRTIDSSGLAGRTSHFKFNVDTTAPVVSELTSSSHPDPNVWYPQLNYNVSWSTAADLSGIAGYSLLVDRKADAVVDQWVDSESASLTGELLYGHEWYVRVRAKDKAGNWGPVQSLRIRGGVDVDPSIGVVPPEEPDDFVTEKTDGVEVRLDSIGTVDPWKISVVRNRELTPRSAKVMASPAYDIFVPSNATYSSAVVTVPYRPTLLNGWPEGALRLYHFDESIGLWVKASGNQLVDTEANTVSATVDHFSTYAVFALGQDGFEQFWPTREVFCVQNGSNGNGVDISFLMDTSGSMSSNDPNNLRVQAAKLFVDKMTTSDGAAVVGFEDVATRYIGLTRLDTASNRSAVLQALDSTAIAGGGTNIQAAVEEAITILTGNLPGRARVALLLSDGHSSAYNSAVTSAAKTAGIVVHTVGLGSDDATLLGSIANGTGGTYRRLTSAEQLPNAYAEIAQTLIDDGTDTDGDGLTDCEESNGMLTSSGIWGIAPDPFTNDRRVTSNPNDPDTENDGLTDGEELLGGVAPDALGIPLDLRDYPASVEEYSFLIKAGITKYFIMRSDPNLVDTDNEGLTDLEETRGKLHPNGQTYTCRPDLFDTDMDGNDDLTEFNIGSDCRLPDENELAIPGLPANTMFQPYFWSPRPVIASHWVARNGVLDYQILNSTPVIYDPADNRCMENCVALYDHAANQPDGSWCWVPFRECSSDEEQVRELVENAVESQHVFTDSGMFARTYAARQAVAECKSTTNDNPACADPAALKRAPDEISELLDDWIAEMILNIPGGYRPNDLCGNSSTDAGTYRLVEFNKKTGARTTRYVGQTSDFTVRRAQHLRDPRFKNLTFEPVHRTTNYQARRGLEQRLYNDTWGDVPISQAQAQGSLNGQRPIASNSPSLLERLELAQSFLTNC